MNTVATPLQNNIFNEAQWLRVLFLLSDTEQWLQQQHTNNFYALPLKNHRKLLRKGWWLGAGALAHILERHYYKIARHPGAGKFTIDIPGIVDHIRDAFLQEPVPLPQSCHLQRVLDTGHPIGFDDKGNMVSMLTVIADAAGRIVTAFPGTGYVSLVH